MSFQKASGFSVAGEQTSSSVTGDRTLINHNLHDSRQTTIRGVYGDPIINLDGTTAIIDGIYGSPILNIQGEGAIDSEIHPGTTSTVGRSWRVVLGEISKHENERVENWVNDLDTLLVVGGLWSILVAFFTLESYRWLSEQPTVTLLTQISQQLSDQNAQTSFRPSASVIRINCFWFLSLIMSVACTIIGLLCKQWLHQHCRHTHTRTQMEALALQRLRVESLDRWWIPHIITQLPILLQLALLLFLIGLLELFWLSNIILFAIGLAAISLILLFYSATTYLSAAQVLLHSLTSQPYNDSPATTLSHLRSLGSVCPYKSPQSWVVFSVMRSVLQNPLTKHVLYRLSRGRPSFGPFQDALDRNLNSIIDWSSFDLEVIRTFEGMKNAPPVHGIKGLQWLLKSFRNTESIPHLKNILVNSLPSNLTSLVASTAFDDWKLSLWKKMEKADVGQALKDPITFFPRARSEAGLDPYGADHFGPSPQSPVYTQLLYYLSSWGNDDFDWKSRYEMTEWLYSTEIPLRARMPFVVPFYELEKLWRSPTPTSKSRGAPSSSRDRDDDPEQLYEQRISIDFLYFYKLGWSVASKLESGHHDKLALVKAITDNIIINSDKFLFLPSNLTSFPGYNFLRFLDGVIKEERLDENGDWIFADIMPRWTRAFELVRGIHDDADAERWRGLRFRDSESEGEVLSEASKTLVSYSKTEPNPLTPPQSPPPHRPQSYPPPPGFEYQSIIPAPGTSSPPPSDYYNPIVRGIVQGNRQQPERVAEPSSRIIRYPSDDSDTIPTRRRPRPPTMPSFSIAPPEPSWYRSPIPARPRAPPSPIAPPERSRYRAPPARHYYGGPSVPPPPSSVSYATSSSAKVEPETKEQVTDEEVDSPSSDTLSISPSEGITIQPPTSPPSPIAPSWYGGPPIPAPLHTPPLEPSFSLYRPPPTRHYYGGPSVPPPPSSVSYATSSSAKVEPETEEQVTDVDPARPRAPPSPIPLPEPSWHRGSSNSPVILPPSPPAPSRYRGPSPVIMPPSAIEHRAPPPRHYYGGPSVPPPPSSVSYATSSSAKVEPETEEQATPSSDTLPISPTDTIPAEPRAPPSPIPLPELSWHRGSSNSPVILPPPPPAPSRYRGPSPVIISPPAIEYSAPPPRHYYGGPSVPPPPSSVSYATSSSANVEPETEEQVTDEEVDSPSSDTLPISPSEGMTIYRGPIPVRPRVPSWYRPPPARHYYGGPSVPPPPSSVSYATSSSAKVEPETKEQVTDEEVDNLSSDTPPISPLELSEEQQRAKSTADIPPSPSSSVRKPMRGIQREGTFG